MKHISHTNLKVILLLLTVLVILFGMFAFHSLRSENTLSDTSDPSSSDNDISTDIQPDSQSSSGSYNGSADSENNKSSKSSSKTQQVGAEKYGFLTVPDTWRTFTDPDASSITGSSVKQYCDETGQLIVTLNCTEDPQTDAKSAASSCWSQMEQEGASDIQGATVQLAGCEAYQVYGYYTEDDVMLVIWVFSDSDSILHYISAEGPIDSVMTAVKLVENTFTLSTN